MPEPGEPKFDPEGMEKQQLVPDEINFGKDPLRKKPDEEKLGESQETPELKNTRLEVSESKINQSQGRILEQGTRELIVEKVSELALKVESILHPSVDQELVWEVVLIAPMPVQEKESRIKAEHLKKKLGYGITHKKFIERFLKEYHLELSEEEEIRKLHQDYLDGQASPEKDEVFERKMKEKAVASMFPDFSQAYAQNQIKMILKEKDFLVSEVDNVRVFQNNDLAYIKWEGYKSFDQVAESIVDQLKKNKNEQR